MSVTILRFAMEEKISGKDLTKEPPRGPHTFLGVYPILGRTLDKCRALLAGSIGEYHFDCPLDNALFGWKRISGDSFKTEVATGARDEEMVRWVDSHGRPKTEEEKAKWADTVKATSYYNDPAQRENFIAETQKLGLDPAMATLFDWLEADDKASFAQAH